ncbi:MAG TPA: amino acid adenylation domain-containing protein [Candidatus Limnocylindrales bacterium]|nr:amino acid adenylation domain-containing protein [Candidatus Limnocylindrales bacterium]
MADIGMTPLERDIARAWAESIGRDEIGAEADFFALGGNSLHAATIIDNLQQRLDLSIPPHLLFESPTVTGFARRIELLQASTLTGLESIERRQRPGAYWAPASFAQRGLWTIDRMHGQSAAYSIPVAFEVQGTIDADALRAALDWLTQRHDSLRTCFEVVDGQIEQVVVSRVDTPLTCIDLGGLGVDEREEAAVGHLIEAAQRPFDLSQPPLLRMDLLLLDEQSSVLFFNMHHIITDGRSTEILVTEFLEAYQAFAAGRPPELPEPPIRYADFSDWQYGQVDNTLAAEQTRYWRQALEQPPPPLDFPTDRPRGAGRTSAGTTASAELPAEVTQQVRELAQAQGCTVFNVMLAGMSVLLSRYTGQTDIVIGTPVLNRRQPEAQRVLGLFVNTLALRADLGGDPGFLDLLERVRRVTIGAFKHQELPLDRVVNEVRPTRDGQQPLFQVMLAYQYDQPLPAIPGLSLTRLELDSATSRFDLTLIVTERPDGLRLALEYNTDLFLPDTIDRLLRHLSMLVTAATHDPRQRVSQMAMLDADEAGRITAWSHPPAISGPVHCLHRLFEETAARQPHAVAIVDGGEQISYRELDLMANRVAQRLRQLEISADRPVGLLTHRSAGMYAGMLGIMKAGGAYLPIDPGAPADRIAYLIQDAHLSTVLADTGNIERLDGLDVTAVDVDEAARAATDPPPHPSPNNIDMLAYVIYTSGSTGKPKGVEVSHSQIYTFISWLHRHLPLGPGDRVVQYLSYFWDGSVMEIWHTLTSGAALVVAPLDVVLDPLGLPKFIADHAVNQILLTPTQMQAALEGNMAMPTLRRLVFGGERLTPELVESCWAVLPPEGAIWNVYGPTECAVVATTAVMRRGDPTTTVPIGQPLEGVTCLVFDEHRNLQPIGVPGELWIGGPGVARGYLGRPALTAQQFQPNPRQPGGRLYRSGDIARWDSGGRLHFIGRRDHQVKIRGVRVELGEIEATLREHPSVREAVVVLDATRLIAYLVPADGHAPADPADRDLRAHAVRSLPGHMVPSDYVTVPRVPRTAGGKLDRDALPKPQPPAEAASEVRTARTPLEQTISGIWAEVFGVDQIDVGTDFYALGGNSLLVVDVVTRLREELGLEIPMTFMFPAPTVIDLALRIELLRWNYHQQQTVAAAAAAASDVADAALPDDIEEGTL